MVKARPYVVIFNLVLAAIFCFGVAFFPYFLSASGEGFHRIADMFSAINDADRISASMVLSSFYFPFGIGLFALATVTLSCTSRFDDKLVVVLKIFSFVAVTLVVVSSILMRSVHIAVVALIPIGFALLSSRRWSVEQK